ncbi:MAG: LacI family DNA-binding transcriptional regulator [bacterium]
MSKQAGENPKNLNINTLAKLAQVSKGTVSKALNGRPGVGEKTRARILELATQLDFRPNSSAQALVHKRTQNIGVLIPHEAGQTLTGPYWPRIITSIAASAATADYNVLLLTPKTEGDIESAYRIVLQTRRVDGLIIGSELLDTRSISRLVVQELPFVLIGRNPGFADQYVDVDNRSAAYETGRYMARHGFRRLGLLSGPVEYPYTGLRIEGFRGGVHDFGGELIAVESAETYDTVHVRDAVRRMLSHGGVDGLFIASGGDFMFDTLDELRVNGCDPKSIGLTVFDDYRYIDFIEPKLTAVRQPLEAMGRAATTMLFSLMAGESDVVTQVTLPATIVARESCGETGSRLERPKPATGVSC